MTDRGAPEGNNNAAGHGAPEGNTNAVGNDGGAPEGNGNAITHGATADPWNLYDHVDEEGRAWIDAIADAYADHLGYEPDDRRRDMLTQAAIHLYQSRSAEARLLEDGLSKDVTLGVDDDGNPVTRSDEHHLNGLSIDRSKEARRILKDLDALSPPEQQAAESARTFAEAIKAAASDDGPDQ
jgi:hypothetical protein